MKLVPGNGLMFHPGYERRGIPVFLKTTIRSLSLQLHG